MAIRNGHNRDGARSIHLQIQQFYIWLKQYLGIPAVSLHFFYIEVRGRISIFGRVLLVLNSYCGCGTYSYSELLLSDYLPSFLNSFINRKVHIELFIVNLVKCYIGSAICKEILCMDISTVIEFQASSEIFS